ncbi:hypothetical protein NDU88_001703 [Pleurodeles waltl]|uniref:Protein BUD31 homolog n=2 Tax=Pleurodeles waltl TaxID=8319 RepID=A0AAV7M623_PLEWA|nr:hypothetical protein NDU88_001703 [Pleurodeles waltl]
MRDEGKLVQSIFFAGEHTVNERPASIKAVASFRSALSTKGKKNSHFNIRFCSLNWLLKTTLIQLLADRSGSTGRNMPKVKRSRKAPPDGWELIEPTLDELDQKMREAETDPHEGKRKVESLWPIFRIHHQKTRYIFDLFYKRKAISRELYEYCIREGYADKNLIAKWKKQGYENLCCLRCIQTRDTNFGTNCICRVPKSKLEVGRIIECTHCGCRGCSG